MGDEEAHQQSLPEEAESVLREARMILPGIQALFGFQMIAVFQEAFHERLEPGERLAHVAALVLVVAAVALGKAPAAFQRQAEPQLVTRRFVSFSSSLLRGALFALSGGLVVDGYLVGRLGSGTVAGGISVAVAVAAMTLGLWFVVPAIARRSRRPPARALHGAPHDVGFPEGA